MKTLSQFLLAAALSIWGLTVSAQTTETTPNLIRSGAGHTWTGVGTGALPGGAMPGGPGALYDPNTNTIHFSYGQSTAAQTFAINQALSGSGIQISGYNYSWQINNLNYDNRQGGTDTLTARVLTYGPDNVTVRRQDSWTYNTKFDWTTFSGTVNYVNPGPVSEFGNMRVEFSGVDGGFWGGYFGPQVRNVDVRMRYTATPVDPCVADPQSSPACPGYKTYYNNMWDDGYERVDLPFVFPFYGRTFTTSYMFTNGVVGFLDPPQNSFCCSGVNMNQNPGSPWNYAIYGLQTDLGSGPDSRFWSQVGDGGTSMRYGWDRVYDLGTNNASTFNIQIKDTGYIGINYESVNSQYNITAGIAGDISQGEYSQIYHGWGGGFNPAAQYTFTGTEITDQCVNNPLWSTSCPGYQQAYFDQQCSYNPLYNSQCPGYQQAYFSQQCSQNTLYDPACPGYATAYYNYQCSVSALYHTGCPGYATAYFDQQCSLNTLYNSQCPGYAAAYFDQQCSQDPLYNNQCPGYADAYYVQQCTASPLYDSGCDGYATAYFNQQCSLNTLYNSQCPGYETAYFNQQCGLDALYNSQCPGYSEAYALKYIVVADPQVAAVEPETVVVAQATVAETTEVIATAAIESAPAPAVSASPAAAATAPVSLVAASAPATSAPAAEKKTETRTETAPAGGGSGESKSRPATTRQALAQRRLEAAREKAAESANANPGGMSSQMDSAASMEQQAELQNVVIGAMGFVPGFDAYGRVVLQDAVGYRPFEIYKGQRNVDSAAARGLLGRSDRIHQDMVDSQYNK